MLVSGCGGSDWPPAAPTATAGSDPVLSGGNSTLDLVEPSAGDLLKLGSDGGAAEHAVVGPVGFTGGKPGPARTTALRRDGDVALAVGDSAGDGLGDQVDSRSVPAHSGEHPVSSVPTAIPSDLPENYELPENCELPTNYRGGGAEAAMMNRFLTDYLALLDGRLATIRRLLGTTDEDEARTALLSLESTSGMIGAHTLVARLHELRALLHGGSAVEREELMAAIEIEAARIRRACETG